MGPLLAGLTAILPDAGLGCLLLLGFELQHDYLLHIVDRQRNVRRIPVHKHLREIFLQAHVILIAFLTHAYHSQLCRVQMGSLLHLTADCSPHVGGAALQRWMMSFGIIPSTTGFVRQPQRVQRAPELLYASQSTPRTSLGSALLSPLEQPPSLQAQAVF